MPHRLDRPIVGGRFRAPPARPTSPRDRREESRAAPRCARPTSGSSVRPTGSFSCSRRRSRRTRHDPGYIRAYPPGIRENGGQYTHAATWLGWAYAALGDGARAERIFRILNPILRARTREEADRYRVEPYVLAGDVYGAAPWVGRGGWTWYTGAAAWLWRLGVEGILGLRKEDGELRIDPCIPPAWKGFEAWVRLGGQQVHVVVENPDAVAQGRPDGHARRQRGRFEPSPPRSRRDRRARSVRTTRQRETRGAPFRSVKWARAPTASSSRRTRGPDRPVVTALPRAARRAWILRLRFPTGRPVQSRREARGRARPGCGAAAIPERS